MRDEAKFCPYCGTKAEIALPEKEMPEISRETEENTPISLETPAEKFEETTEKTELAEIVEETCETPELKKEMTEIKKETEEIKVEMTKTSREMADISMQFDDKDGLFVISEEANDNISTKKTKNGRKSKFPIFAAVFAAIAVTAVAAAYYVPNNIIPSLKYKNAEQLFLAADYDSAEAAFAELGNYGESADYIIKCRYGKASQLMTEGLYPEAADAFTRLDGYENSDELVKECMVKIAENYLENGELEAAMSTYTAAGKPELAEAAALKRAETLAGEGNYFEAAELAEKYCEKELSDEYFYLGAEKARAESDFKTAADAFYKLGDYKNSAALAEECTYGFYSSEYAKNGASEETARGFYFLGNFRDSRQSFIMNSYEYGVKCLESGDYAAAAAMFSNAAGYRDAGGQLYIARYELGKSLEAESPASARSVFAMLGNYRDSAARKNAVSQNTADSWYADGFTSVESYRTTVFSSADTVTVYCTAGTDSPSPPITVTVSLEDGSGKISSADYENVRNSGSFSVNFPLNGVSAGTAKITVSRKSSGAVLREFEIYISE